MATVHFSTYSSGADPVWKPVNLDDLQKGDLISIVSFGNRWECRFVAIQKRHKFYDVILQIKYAIGKTYIPTQSIETISRDTR